MLSGAVLLDTVPAQGARPCAPGVPGRPKVGLPCTTAQGGLWQAKAAE